MELLNPARTPKFTEADEGKRVVLPANEAEGWEREEGTILRVYCMSGVEVMLIVEVDDEHTDGNLDDGIREVSEDDAELA